MKRRISKVALALMFLLTGCGSGGDSGLGTAGCSGNCGNETVAFLTVQDVEKILAQAVDESQARGAKATIAVTDRVGNVLAVFKMKGAQNTFRIDGGRGVKGGLEEIAILPSEYAAISKAITGAYLSSEGNAFTSRTASQIVQEHFNPLERNQPSGPLFGVQFSQLACGDLVSSLGPKPSPLGLSADPGGLPLYKNGALVGGIGVLADGVYGLATTDDDVDEAIALVGQLGFEAPEDRRADRITADGRSFEYSQTVRTKGNPLSASYSAALAQGALSVATNFYPGTSIRSGTRYGDAASGIRADSAMGAWILVDSSNQNRFAPRGGTDGLLTQTEVSKILQSAYAVAGRARAQIRRPLPSPAQVSISVVDTNGEVLGLVRTPDAPVFGADVSLQKARSAAFFSSAQAGAQLSALPAAQYLPPNAPSPIGAYVRATQTLLNSTIVFSGEVAFSNRAIGNIARPFFPDGIESAPTGPLSKPIAAWSPFSVGIQSDLIFNAVVKALTATDASGIPAGCTGVPNIKNGIQIFPGSVPIYRGEKLVGAIGVSGDGVDQDDMIAFLGLANAGKALNTGISNAPLSRRADQLEPAGIGSRLRYVQCPQAPFIDSSEQNVCASL